MPPSPLLIEFIEGMHFFFSTKTSWGFKRLIFYIKMAYLFVVLHTSIYQFILKITYNIRPANFSFTYFSVY